MTKDLRYQKLLETSWRRKLSPPEEAELRAWLAAHPESEGDWAAESGLNEALDRLRDVPVANNFTARVLQAAAAESRGERVRPATGRWRSWTAWAPRFSFAASLVVVAFSAYHIGATARQRQLAAGIEAVADVSSLPSPEILKDFDAIRSLPASPKADLQLLAVMQ